MFVCEALESTKVEGRSKKCEAQANKKDKANLGYKKLQGLNQWTLCLFVVHIVG
jgi:hypothetical protein